MNIYWIFLKLLFNSLYYSIKGYGKFYLIVISKIKWGGGGSLIISL